MMGRLDLSGLAIGPDVPNDGRRSINGHCRLHWNWHGKDFGHGEASSCGDGRSTGYWCVGVYACRFADTHRPLLSLALRRLRRFSHAGVWAGVFDDAGELYPAAGSRPRLARS